MSDHEEIDERAWAAERRDFVADHRDDIAAERDGDADDRETTADDREWQADHRQADLEALEQRLDVRGAELGVPPSWTPADRELIAAQRAHEAGLRDGARVERQRRAADRDRAAAARAEAAARREEATPQTQLALAFAEIARHLYEAQDFDDVLTRIVLVAVSTVQGCDMASITVREEDGYHTVASTHAAATESDRAQYEAGEGPCIDAIDEAVVYTPAFPDSRWPVLAARPKNSGIGSVMSYRLTSVRDDRLLAGSLNAYATTSEAFDADAREIGLILAAHASLAVGAVRQREALEVMSRQLHQALSSRDVIGQAKGILMERLRITPEEAFDALRRSSQRLNVKLREVAARLAETGEFDDTMVGPQS